MMFIYTVYSAFIYIFTGEDQGNVIFTGEDQGNVEQGTITALIFMGRYFHEFHENVCSS